jgi:tRNA splicing endonuclease
MSSEVQINYKQIEEQIDKYLYEYNIVALVNTLQYVLGYFKIYFNVQVRDIVLAYRDLMSTGVLVSIILRFGTAIKVYLKCDKERQKVESVDVWVITE